MGSTGVIAPLAAPCGNDVLGSAPYLEQGLPEADFLHVGQQQHTLIS